MRIEVQGRKKRGRPKSKGILWLDRVRGGIKGKGLSGEEVLGGGILCSVDV